MRVILTGLIGGLLAAFLIGNVRAADNPQTLTCDDVRAVVALFKGDVEKAVKAARDAGATEQQIAWARKCLSP